MVPAVSLGSWSF